MGELTCPRVTDPDRLSPSRSPDAGPDRVAAVRPQFRHPQGTQPDPDRFHHTAGVHSRYLPRRERQADHRLYGPRHPPEHRKAGGADRGASQSARPGTVGPRPRGHAMAVSIADHTGRGRRNHDYRTRPADQSAPRSVQRPGPPEMPPTARSRRSSAKSQGGRRLPSPS